MANIATAGALALLFAFAACAAPPSPPAAAAAATAPPLRAGWHRVPLLGFEVREKDTFAAHPRRQAVFAFLTEQLARIDTVLPAAALARLRHVPIWVGDEDPRYAKKAMVYHPSAAWLREHEQREFLAGGVEIACAEHFVAWQRDQPWMVLHELAHAYHHQVLGHDHAGIRACFAAARTSGRYEHVAHVGGSVGRHYGMNNEQEYFAEATEAFFGRNDFAPFDRAALRAFDPDCARLLEEVWGVAPAPAGR